MKRRGRKSAAQTPAPAKERVYGSKKNPAGSAASKSSASKIQLSQSIIKTLKDKVAKYNESHKKDVSLSTAKAVMRRGMGAYSKSHRPTITGGAPNSRQAWGFARVNKFLKKKSGEPVKKAYVQDDDLLEDGGEIKGIVKAKTITYTIDDFKHDIELSERWLTDWQRERWVRAGQSEEQIERDIKLAKKEISLLTSRTPFTTWFLDIPKGQYKFEIAGATYEIKKDVRKVDVEFGWKRYKQNKNFWYVVKTNDVQTPFDKYIVPFMEIYLSKTREYDSKERMIDGINRYFKNLIREDISEYPLPKNPDIRYKDGGQLSLGAVYSGSKVKTYLNKAEFKDQSFFQFINNGDKYILKSLTIKDLVSRDSTLQSFLKSDEAKYESNTDELSLIYKYPIVVGDTDYGKNIVLDGYHRIAQAIANGQSKINAFVKIGSEYKDGGEIENYLKNVRIEPSDSGRLYRANFGESGGISWEITESYFDKDASNYGKDPNNPKSVIVQTIDSNRSGSKGEGAKAIASLFLRYTNLKEILYDDYSDGFWERIGGKDDVLKREDFFKYFNSKFNLELFDDGGDLPVGRLAKGMNLYDIAKHHKTTVAELKKELELGIKTEMEHTYDKEIARAIAYDHLFENPRYYSDLSELEMKAEARKLEDFYASGGQTGQSCKVVDQQGEALTDRESLEQMTECLENLPQTKSMYFDPQKNDYTPERKKLHRQIILDFKKDLVCVESTNPIAILMGGSPASGKSTFLKKYAPYLLKSEILKVDADEIRAKLPEYEGFNASQTHLETKDIVNTLLSDRSIGIPCRFDVIYDGTMNSTKSYLPLINLLKSLGYKVFIVYIDKVPKDVVIRRSIERYKRSGRFVPLSVIDDFFEKGTEALDKLKGSVDGYMVIDGSDTEYKIIERGGMRLPKNRNYSKIGEPINVQESEIVREFKRGGEINPDDPKIKNQVTHKSGAAGGLLVGRRHSEGGIKAINKSTGQPLEMEGGEVVITRDAVSDPTLVEFEGKKMTKRQVLSAINESGGGVSFAEGGDIPDKCSCSGKQYNYGGKVIKDVDIVNDIMSSHRKGFGIPYRDLPHSEAIKKMFEGYYPKMEEGGEVYEEGGLVTLINKRVPSYKSFAEKNKDVSQVALKRNYKDYLKSNFDLDFNDLPHSIQVALLLGNQKIVDNYLNS